MAKGDARVTITFIPLSGDGVQQSMKAIPVDSPQATRNGLQVKLSCGIVGASGEVPAGAHLTESKKLGSIVMIA